MHDIFVRFTCQGVYEATVFNKVYKSIIIGFRFNKANLFPNGFHLLFLQKLYSFCGIN